MAYDDQILGAKQQLETARKLREGVTLPQAQMVSGHYVAPHEAEYLANLFKTYVNRKSETSAEEKLAELLAGKQKATEDWMTSMPQDTPERQAQDGIVDTGSQSIPSYKTIPANVVTPEQRLAWIMKGQQIDPQAAGVGAKYMEMEQSREAASQEKSANRLWQEQQNELNRQNQQIGWRIASNGKQGDGSSLGNIQPGFARIKDETSATGFRDEPIQGGAPYQKMADKHAGDISAVNNAIADADNLIKRADKLATHPGLQGNFGVKSYVPNLRGTPAGDAETLLNELKDSMQLSGFAALRSNAGSPGAMTEKEWPKLEAAIAKLQNASSVKGATDALADIKIYAGRIKATAKQGYDNEWSKTQFHGGKNAEADPLGLR